MEGEDVARTALRGASPDAKWTVMVFMGADTRRRAMRRCSMRPLTTSRR